MSDDKPISKRIFINHVDTYTCLNIAKYLRTCIPGASLDEDEPEEENETEIEGFIKNINTDICFDIHGTLKNKNSKKPNSVNQILKYDTREEYFEHLVESDVMIFDIMEDINQIEEALWAANALHENLQLLEKEKIFILLSSIMTWAKTKPTDPDDMEASFNEEDFRHRKPHPNFKEQFNAEKEILKLSKKHKSKIKMYVVASGILYGEEENFFHDLFKKSWNNCEELIVYGKGNNVLPTIHVKDLAGILQNVVDSKPSNKYILAIDDSKNTLEEIIKSISSTLSTGNISRITKEEVLVENRVQPHNLEIFLTDLRLEAGTIKEDMKIKWVAETGLVENMEIIVSEYKMSRNLLPIKVCILGPPGSGKSYYCDKLAKSYQLKHLRMKEVISEFMKRLVDTIAYPKKLQELMKKDKTDNLINDEEAETNPNFTNEELEDCEAKALSAKELQEKLLNSMAENKGRLNDEDLVMIYKETLLRKDCQNHGFVLDGFPKTKEQAQLLFAPEAEEEENLKKLGFNNLITPEHVFFIQASDEFLINRNAILTSCQGAAYDNFRQRLAAYKAINDDLEARGEETVVTYFDLREIHPVILNLKEDLSKEDEIRIDTMNNINYELGPPHTYGPSEEEQTLFNLKKKEAAEKQHLLELENNKVKEADMLKIRKHNQSEWNENLELVRQQQYEYLETRNLPLRNYLMHLVMPVLTEGLMNCSKVRSEDPIDYLSEFILKSYNKQSSEESNT